jgi:F0F1-type ATP synthase assembly protein I
LAAENPPPPASPRPPRRDRNNSSTSRQFGLALELPFILVSAIVVGGAFGYFLDRWLGTSPLFLIILGGVGFYAGVRDVLRRLAKEGNGNGSA